MLERLRLRNYRGRYLINLYRDSNFIWITGTVRQKKNTSVSGFPTDPNLKARPYFFLLSHLGGKINKEKLRKIGK